MNNFLQQLQSKILVFDGVMGVSLQNIVINGNVVQKKNHK